MKPLTLKKLLNLPPDAALKIVCMDDAYWGYTMKYFNTNGYKFTDIQFKNFIFLRREYCRLIDWAESENRKIPRLPVPTRKCDCGHTVPVGSVMSASMGSSCVDCYDRMSG